MTGKSLMLKINTSWQPLLIVTTGKCDNFRSDLRKIKSGSWELIDLLTI